MKLRILRHVGERALRKNTRFCQVVPSDGRASTICLRDPRKDLHGRAFASAIRANEERELAGLHAQRQTAKHHLLPVGFLQIIRDNHLAV